MGSTRPIMKKCMDAGKKIQILLSTYNGEKYLRAQLDSFVALEEFELCTVLIRDDGSNDGTRDILQEYASKYDFQIVFGENIGFIRSYQWLIHNSDAQCDYFALSDQDDVWAANKISVAYESLCSHSGNQPVLFASRSCIVDEGLNYIGKSVFPRHGVHFYNAMVQNVLPGHTQVFNRSLRESLLTHDFSKAHGIDWWIYLVASSFGKIVYCEDCTVYHRQHGDNAVGYQINFWGNFKRRLMYIRQKKGNAIALQLQAFYQAYGNELPQDYHQELESFLTALPHFYTRLNYLLRAKFFRQRTYENSMVYILYLFGKYKIGP